MELMMLNNGGILILMMIAAFVVTIAMNLSLRADGLRRMAAVRAASGRRTAQAARDWTKRPGSVGTVRAGVKMTGTGV